MNPEYVAWRARIPFSDAEIADALHAEALERARESERAWLRVEARKARAGWVSGKGLNEALPRLVKVCGVCGKTALYRLNMVGRCRDHRFVPERATLRRNAEREIR